MPIFAHATGFSWDEALMVMAPIAAVAALLFLANSRAKHLGESEPEADSADVSTSGSPGGSPIPDSGTD